VLREDAAGTLHREILGLFDPAGEIHIYPGRHETNSQSSLTYIHEESHLKAVSCTTFGEVQSILGWLAHSKDGPEDCKISDEAASMLSSLVMGSWKTHEGFAMCRERWFGSRLLPHTPSVPCPASYVAAFLLYDDVMKALPPQADAFCLTVVQAIMEAAMNTLILRSLKPETLLTSAVLDHLAQPQHSPDSRLSELSTTIKGGGFRRDLIDRLRDAFAAAVKRAGVARGDLRCDALGDEIACSMGPEYVELVDAWQELGTKVMWDELSCLDLSYPLVAPNAAQIEICHFREAARKAFSRKGHTLPVKRIGDQFEAALQAGEVQLKGDSPFGEQVVFMAHALSPLNALLADQNSRFIVQLSRIKALQTRQAVDADYVWSTHVTVLVPSPGRIPSPTQDSLRGGFAPSYEVYTFWGTEEFALCVARDLSPRTVLLTMGPSLVDLPAWHPDATAHHLLRELGRVPLLVLPPTGCRLLYDLIVNWQTIGIDKVFLVDGNETTECYAFALSTDLTVMVTMPAFLPSVLSTYRPHVAGLLSDAWKRTAKEPALRFSGPFGQIHARDVHRLDALGLFQFAP